MMTSRPVSTRDSSASGIWHSTTKSRMSGRIINGWFLKMLSPTRAVRNSPPMLSGR